MRALFTVSFFAALLSGSAAFASTGPCGVATKAEVARVLGGPSVDVPASEIGEETAPTCLWATAERKAQVQITIWSRDELPVLGIADAESYFAKLKAEFTARGPVAPLAGLGEQAFAAGFVPATAKADGAIVVLKAGRVIVFDFVRVFTRNARAFAASVIGRL